MTYSDHQLRSLCDPRLASHATSARPAWLFVPDGSRLLWANPPGARAFGAANSAGLAMRMFGPADARRRQVVQLARRLPESGVARLERLRGFGGSFGGLVTCSCARLAFGDASHGILIAPVEGSGRTMPLPERLQRLVEGIEGPVAAFGRDGMFLGASEAARRLFGFRDLRAAGLEAARKEALATGRAEASIGSGHLVLQRVGAGADIGLVAFIAPAATPDIAAAYIAAAVTAGQPLTPATEEVLVTPPEQPAPETPAPAAALPDAAQETAASPHPAGSADTASHPEHAIATDQAPDRTLPAIAPAPASVDLSAFEPIPSESPLEPPGNVVPFRPPPDAKPPMLSPVENNAFDELARQLSERLENGNGHGETHAPAPGPEPAETALPPAELSSSEPPRPQPEWLEEPQLLARAFSERDRTLLDLLPTGVLIYRLDRLLYANPAFLRQMGYASLHALEQAGGVEALYVEAGSAGGSSTSEAGTPVTISVVEENGEVTSSIEARLYTISWDGDSALALMFSPAPSAAAAPPVLEQVPASPPSAVGHANAEELGAILDTTAEGIVMFDAGGNMHACNRSAEALFGYDGAELVRRNLTELFAPESRRVVLDYLESTKGFGVESLLDHGREVLGRVSRGGLIPLSMTMGRTRPDGPNFFAVFRDVSQNRKGESEVQQARRLTETAANAKADLLARISHEMRAPLNAIIGFAEVMICERFGALGNERYVDYMKDIRACGGRVIAMIDDLLELSRIETGKLELAFANQNLNELVESCVAAMQREANRERIIIRTSLAPALPSVVADARALRQIALNLIGNSLRLANSGGQVIVSTALTDFGEVVLRVRDNGHGLNQGDVAAALEPFRNPPSEQTSGSSAVNLSLTKALVEANRAQFHIRTAPQSGTLIEVVFPHALARA
jgi:PAS domain S-box-containing protein